jgi:hypothetical protein
MKKDGDRSPEREVDYFMLKFGMTCLLLVVGVGWFVGHEPPRVQVAEVGMTHQEGVINTLQELDAIDRDLVARATTLNCPSFVGAESDTKEARMCVSLLLNRSLVRSEMKEFIPPSIFDK